jgi:hypothetical protein
VLQGTRTRPSQHTPRATRRPAARGVTRTGKGANEGAGATEQQACALGRSERTTEACVDTNSERKAKTERDMRGCRWKKRGHAAPVSQITNHRPRCWRFITETLASSRRRKGGGEEEVDRAGAQLAWAFKRHAFDRAGGFKLQTKQVEGRKKRDFRKSRNQL